MFNNYYQYMFIMLWHVSSFNWPKNHYLFLWKKLVVFIENENNNAFQKLIKLFFISLTSTGHIYIILMLNKNFFRSKT